MTATPTLDREFAASVRDELGAIGTHRSGLERRRRRARFFAFGAAAVAVGAVTTAAAVIATIPGETSVVALGSPVAVTATGTSTIQLGAAPAGANSVVLDVTCVSGTGTVSVPATRDVVQNANGTTSPGGPEFTSWKCADVHRTVHIDDGYLPSGATSIEITADPGTTWTAVARYGDTSTTAWGVNAHGQTYGAPNKKNGTPDLQSAQATNGAIGYISTKQLMSFHGNGYIDVYESDGTTVIGKFPIGNVDGQRSVTSPAPDDGSH